MKSFLAKDVDEYISYFPINVQNLLTQLRKTIRKAAPGAKELISYQMPAYQYNGMLVFFGGYQNHIGFYPGAGSIAAFHKEITAYHSSKGTIQFPLDKPLPVQLISRIVKHRVNENEIKAQIKQGLKKKNTDSFLLSLASPARKALENNGIHSLAKLSTYSEEKILQLHGMGQSSLPKLRIALKNIGLSFKKS